MASKTPFQARSSVQAAPVDFSLLQQSKFLITEAIPELELKLKRELDLITKEQILLSDEFKTITGRFAYRLINVESNISHFERSHPTSRSKMQLLEEIGNDLDTLRYNDNQPIEAHNEIGIEADLRFPKVADRLEAVEAHMETVPGNSQIANTKGHFWKKRDG